ncbi:GntR family transcriptional regulator [Komagataeibacter intermedius]|uniref:Transcriptional regulator n=2 Tax=Komagataeibacter intermedius TaxID=66229 RepID=A0A0N1FBN4_9PROT|nr:GntR family transcriptional regulator [Komagataeibacter intermedius]KPH87409.1 transcriptional regulator [Komagataeibacter intermedius AF2]MCF3636498.1 GntR family transcriptional regulator [Komagataeibacter intermedius]GAN85535.1 transcriptional regulator GntR [Komagataeibacter intermedius TF2]GBQ65730.1 transcriptional regulator [Komagataeibacter intermedius NRIC 0521]
MTDEDALTGNVTPATARARSRRTARKGTTRAPTLASIVQERIQKAIVSGVFTPGMWLEEESLGQMFSVSRTPVREALRRLAAQGTVEIRPRQGVIVTKMNDTRVVQTLEVIAELEAATARLAAERMSDAERDNLHAINEELSDIIRNGSRAGFDRHNERLHAAIRQGAHNEIMADSVTQMRQRVLPYTRVERMESVEQMTVSHGQHQTIVFAILEGHGELAYQTMRVHVMQTGQLAEDGDPDHGD